MLHCFWFMCEIGRRRVQHIMILTQTHTRQYLSMLQASNVHRPSAHQHLVVGKLTCSHTKHQCVHVACQLRCSTSSCSGCEHASDILSHVHHGHGPQLRVGRARVAEVHMWSQYAYQPRYPMIYQVCIDNGLLSMGARIAVVGLRLAVGLP